MRNIYTFFIWLLLMASLIQSSIGGCPDCLEKYGLSGSVCWSKELQQAADTFEFESSTTVEEWSAYYCSFPHECYKQLWDGCCNGKRFDPHNEGCCDGFADELDYQENMYKGSIYNKTDQICIFSDDEWRIKDRLITSVKIEPMDAIIDANPDWAGGGLRIYPDRSSPTDMANRRGIKIVATTTLRPEPFIENFYNNYDYYPHPYDLDFPSVYFKYFDMDDPTSDDLQVDINGQLGDDNRDSISKVLNNNVWIESPNEEGIVDINLMVPMHPGDNFRVVVSHDKDYLESIYVEGTVLKDRDGNILLEERPTKYARTTPLITVWRRLHIEVDSMGPVKGNQVKGTIDAVNPQTSQDMTQINFNGTNSKYLDTDQFENGALYIEGYEDYYEVISNTDTILSVKGVIPVAAIGKSFILVDDDNFKDDNVHTGDEGVDLEARPETFSLLQKSDDPFKNVLAPAFIMPIIDGGGDSSNNNGFLPFVLNLDVDEKNFDKIIHNGLNSAGNEYDDYWVVYFLIAYQPSYFLDYDPATQTKYGEGWMGYSYGVISDNATSEADVPSGSQGCIIFLETMRDIAKDRGSNNLIKIAPHELGHQMGLGGDDNQSRFGIMSYNNELTFVPQHLNILRWRVKSPGM